jgi:hypothetical protein
VGRQDFIENVFGGVAVFDWFGGALHSVPILRRQLHHPEQAPYLAAALFTVVTMVFSFLGHKNISFRPREAEHEQ